MSSTLCINLSENRHMRDKSHTPHMPPKRHPTRHPTCHPTSATIHKASPCQLLRFTFSQQWVGGCLPPAVGGGGGGSGHVWALCPPVKSARRFGQWLQHPPAATTATRASTHRMVHEITLPPTQLHSFDNFGLIRIIRAWNSLLRLPTFRPSDLDSISTFNSALLTCLPLLPTPIRKSYGLPTTSST